LVAGEDSFAWRVFRASDGLAESMSVAVSVSPRGNVWGKHRESGSVSRLDGYAVTVIPGLAGVNYPVLESRSGQIWSLYDGGLMEYRNRRWVRYAQADVFAENQANALRRVRPIPILPADRDRVLVLLPDRLLEFDSRSNLTLVLREAAASGVGRLHDLCEVPDGGLWVAGDRGLMLFPGPVRRIGPHTPVEVKLVPGELDVHNLERPLWDGARGVTLVGDLGSEGQRAVLHYDGDDWHLVCRVRERVRAAWRSGDDIFWLMARNSLLRWRRGELRTFDQGGLLAGQYYDVAVSTNGTFWLATSEGLMLHAPQLWQTPNEAERISSVVAAMGEDDAARLWFAHAAGLASLQDRQWREVSWPTWYDPVFAQGNRIWPLRSGELAMAGADKTLCYHPESDRFRELVELDGRRVRQLLGSDRPGSVLLQMEEPTGKGAGQRLYRYDGHTAEELADLAGVVSNEDLTFAQRVSADMLWVGLADAVAVWQAGEWRRYGTDQGFPGGRPGSVVDAGGGRLWFGVGGRVVEFDGRRWVILRTGFERVNAMVRAADGGIWVAASTGLFRFFEGSWLGHGAEDGLASSVVYHVHLDREGRVWAGTARGLGLYHPGADRDAPRTEIRVAPELGPVPITEELVIEVGGVDKWKQTGSDRLLYSYRLGQADWSAFQAVPELVLSNLTAGPQRLEVRAMDRNWNIDAQPARFEFAAILPWYREPRILAIAFAALAAVFALAWLAVNRHLRLVRSYAEVERMVQVRTRELEQANAALLHSQKMKALGTLAAGVAHDFNSILSIIKGSAQIIESHLEDKDKIRVRVSRIKTVVDQGGGIVRAILGLARTGQQDLPRCDLNALVGEAVRVFEDRFDGGVQFRVELVPGLPTIRSSADLLQQILLNLVINAVDALGGRGVVLLRTERSDHVPAGSVLEPAGGPPLLRLEVVDRGSGIPPDTLPRIFEPFFTTKAMSSRRGTGLGLTMVYEFARQLGYGLHVTSEVGRGTCFTVLIPISENEPVKPVSTDG
jgi:signal transduction histidine kinase